MRPTDERKMRYHPLGERLREMREKCGLTMREVETQSRQIAEAHQNSEYLITTGRLSQIENSDSVPSVYKFASLSEIYRVPLRELLQIYGVEPTEGPRQIPEDKSEKKASTPRKAAA